MKVRNSWNNICLIVFDLGRGAQKHEYSYLPQFQRSGVDVWLKLGTNSFRPRHRLTCILVRWVCTASNTDYNILLHSDCQRSMWDVILSEFCKLHSRLFLNWSVLVRIYSIRNEYYFIFCFPLSIVYLEDQLQRFFKLHIEISEMCNNITIPDEKCPLKKSYLLKLLSLRKFVSFP